MSPATENGRMLVARMKEAIDAYSSNIKKMHEENAEKRAARELQVA